MYSALKLLSQALYKFVILLLLLLLKGAPLRFELGGGIISGKGSTYQRWNGQLLSIRKKKGALI